MLHVPCFTHAVLCMCTGAQLYVHAICSLCSYYAMRTYLQAYSKCGSTKEAELLLQDTVVSDCVLYEHSYIRICVVDCDCAVNVG